MTDFAIFTLAIIIIFTIVVVVHLEKKAYNNLMNFSVPERNTSVINDIENYFKELRPFVVSMMNETRSSIDYTKQDLRWYETKIRELNEKFANGVTVNEAEDLSDSYEMFAEEKKCLGNELKELKYRFRMYSKILSLIDAKVV